jgi:hypothetical protein
MNLEQAIAKLDLLVFQLEAENFPPPHHWQTIEQSIAVIQQSIATGAARGYGRRTLLDFVSVARMTLGLAKAGGSHAISSVLADENISVFNWLEEVIAS